MTETMLWATVALTTLAGLVVVAQAVLRGWNGWLALRHAEIAARHEAAVPPAPAARIELADLRERVRKLEAIAAGVDL